MYEYKYDNFNLSADFPVVISGMHVVKDTLISCLHIHNCIELGYCFDGSGLFTIEGKILPFTKNDVSVVTDHDFHYATSAPGTACTWRWILLDPSQLLMNSLIGNEESRVLLDYYKELSSRIVGLKEQSEVPGIVYQIILEYDNKLRDYRSAIRSLVWRLIILLNRLPRDCETNGIHAKNHENMMKMMPVLNLLSARYMEKLNVEELHRACFMSKTNFRRLFKQAFKKTPVEYLNYLRISAAMVLLRNTDKPISQISMEVGFLTLSSFNRSFRKHHKATPREFRNSM